MKPYLSERRALNSFLKDDNSPKKIYTENSYKFYIHYVSLTRVDEGIDNSKCFTILSCQICVWIFYWTNTVKMNIFINVEIISWLNSCTVSCIKIAVPLQSICICVTPQSEPRTPSVMAPLRYCRYRITKSNNISKSIDRSLLQ